MFNISDSFADNLAVLVARPVNIAVDVKVVSLAKSDGATVVIKFDMYFLNLC